MKAAQLIVCSVQTESFREIEQYFEIGGYSYMTCPNGHLNLLFNFKNFRYFIFIYK